MKTVIWKDLKEQERQRVLQRPASAAAGDAVRSVRTILDDVKTRGDRAIREYTQRFDGFDPDPLYVEDIDASIDPGLCDAMDAAYANIRRFHERQGYHAFATETMPGLSCERRVMPIGSVGLYVPGGTAPLLSTVLMLGVPSQIAGNPLRVLCTPGSRQGQVHPAILYAAKLCGIIRIARVGGAQAIAGLAYGTESLPAVNKIFGPGNIYVTLAKTLVAQESGGPSIDMPAGPSEVLVIATEDTPPAYAAADLLSQAEHDAASQVVLVATDAKTIEAIKSEVESQLALLPRRNIAAGALENSLAIIAGSLEEAVDISNLYAPEHLILCFEGAERFKNSISNAGSVFCGLYTPESLGDYASGTNHVLPTAAAARAYSGLGVEAFQKTITWQSASRDGLQVIGPAVMAMAEAETLDAHARAIAVRLKGAA